METFEEPTLFAFWDHGSYPYKLGGPITKIHDNGMVETVNFGIGNTFRPVLILPLEAGKKINERLKGLDREHAQELKQFHSDAKRYLQKEFPIFKWEK